MPRQKRVEFEGAIYHIMAKGNRGAVIVEDDIDRECFVNTLSELVDRTGWEVFAWVLMNDHYHLVVRTPEPNLVEGMTWFQSTFTKRSNGRHKMTGHLFTGRYQTHVVEAGEPLRQLINYVHLNPVRNGTVKLPELNSYSWGSFPDYCVPPSARRELMSVASAMKCMRVSDTKKGRELYWKKLRDLSGKEVAEMNVKNGWIVGSDQFVMEVSALLEIGVRDIKNGYGGAQLRGASELTARNIIAEQLEELGMTMKALKKLPKSDERKAMIAHLIRENTSMPLSWIAEELALGSINTASKALKTKAAEIEEESNNYVEEQLAVHLL